MNEYKRVKRSDLEFLLSEIQLLHSIDKNSLNQKLETLEHAFKEMLNGVNHE